MTSSLVGSEMCIRDRAWSGVVQCREVWYGEVVQSAIMVCGLVWRGAGPVSYTHLTLPTICSV
eukprot:10994078-Prorocentrum_lima.AAC.1